MGLFGVPVPLILPPTGGGLPLVEVDNSIIYAATLATTGGEANTTYSSDAEEEEKEKGKNADVKEEGKNDGKPKRNLPMCI